MLYAQTWTSRGAALGNDVVEQYVSCRGRVVRVHVILWLRADKTESALGVGWGAVGTRGDVIPWRHGDVTLGSCDVGIVTCSGVTN